MMVTRYKNGWELYIEDDTEDDEIFYGDCGSSGPMEENADGEWMRFDDLRVALSSITRYSDECGDNDGGDCGLCGNNKEDPNGQWIKFKEIEQFFEGGQNGDANKNNTD